MIAKSAEISFFGGIDKLPFAKRHEVKMLDSFLIVVEHALPELCLVNDFADVLENEFVRRQVDIHTQTVTFLIGLYDGNIGVPSSLKSLILTVRAASTVAEALDFSGTVDAIGVFATSNVLPGAII